MFADDAKLYRCIRDLCDCVSLADNFDAFLRWSAEWGMALNFDKCRVMSFNKDISKSIQFDYQYNTYDGKTGSIVRVNQLKDLGVTFEADCTFDMHIYDKIKLAYSILGIIKRNFSHLDERCLIILYKSLVRSHLEYANSVWNPYRVGLINDLEKVQRRATKLFKRCSRLQYVDRLKLLNIPTLKFRRVRGDMIEVFKILNNLYDSDVSFRMTMSGDSRTRGNSFKLVKSRSKYDIRKYSFGSRVVNLWNSLPDSVILCDTVNSFKNRLDKFWNCEDMRYNSCHEFDVF